MAWNSGRQPIRKLGPQCLNPSIPSVSSLADLMLMQKLPQIWEFQMRHTFHIYAGKEVHNYLCSQLQKEMTENRMEFGFVSNQNDTWGGQM